MMRIHGGRAISAQGLDLSVNINPYGPHPGLWNHLRSVRIDRYPDPSCRLLRELIAADYMISPDEVLIGNGATELLWSAARAFLKNQGTCVVPSPTFSEFYNAARQMEARTIHLRMNPPFRIDWERLSEIATREKPTVISLCNPNSPTGQYEAPENIHALAETFSDSLILLDESFLSLSDYHAAWSRIYPSNVLRVVSLTKDHGIPGLRLGYAVGAAERIASLAAEIPTWSVNELALEAGVFVWDQKDFLADCRSRILADRERLLDALQERGIAALPSTTCFVMMEALPEWQERLWSDFEIHVRSCASYGFPQYWRIAVRPDAAQKHFFAALDVLKGFI